MKKMVNLMLICCAMLVLTACGRESKAESKLDLAADYLRQAEESLNEIDDVISDQKVMESDEYSQYFIEPDFDEMSEQIQEVWEYRKKAKENIALAVELMDMGKDDKDDSIYAKSLEAYLDAVQNYYHVLSEYSKEDLTGNPPVYVESIVKEKMDCWMTYATVKLYRDE